MKSTLARPQVDGLVHGFFAELAKAGELQALLQFGYVNVRHRPGLKLRSVARQWPD